MYCSICSLQVEQAAVNLPNTGACPGDPGGPGRPVDPLSPSLPCSPCQIRQSKVKIQKPTTNHMSL